MIETQHWWQRLDEPTQRWLAAHVHADIPTVIAERVEQVGGHLVDAVWASGSGWWPVRFLRSSDQLWITQHCGVPLDPRAGCALGISDVAVIAEKSAYVLGQGLQDPELRSTDEGNP